MGIRKTTPPALAALTLAAAWPAVAQRAGEDEEFPPFPISVAVARSDDGPAVDRDWIDAQVGWANRIFEPAGLSFRVSEVREVGPEHFRLDTRRDRHALGREMRDRVINWFVVGHLRDVDDPSRHRMGVHWRPAGEGYPRRHFVIVAAHAVPTVLAHELGHFFGNRRHPDTPGNIMSYARGDGTPFFDDRQIRRIRRFARRFVRAGQIVPAGAPAEDG